MLMLLIGFFLISYLIYYAVSLYRTRTRGPLRLPPSFSAESGFADVAEQASRLEARIAVLERLARRETDAE